MEVIKKIKMDFYDNKIMTIDVKQYDVASRYIQVSCYADGARQKLDNTTVFAYIRSKKPDGYNILNSGTVTDDGDLLIKLSTQMLVTPGICLTDIVLIDTETGEVPEITEDGKLQFDGSSSIISTMNFYINIIPVPYAFDDVTSLEDLDGLNNLLDQVYKNYQELATLISEVHGFATTAQEAATRAQEAAADVDLTLLIQSSQTEPEFHTLNGLWLREI